MQLRALQVLAQQPGNTLVLGMSAGATPIPLRDHTASQRPQTPEIPPESE